MRGSCLGGQWLYCLPLHIFFYSCTTCTRGYCLLHIPTLLLSSFLPVSPYLHCLSARDPLPPWECDRSHSLLCCIAFAQSLRKKVRKTCADIFGHFTESVPSLESLKKLPPAQCFDIQAATGGHPSKYWPSAKLLESRDRLVPDTYYTLNAVRQWEIYIF